MSLEREKVDFYFRIHSLAKKIVGGISDINFQEEIFYLKTRFLEMQESGLRREDIQKINFRLDGLIQLHNDVKFEGVKNEESQKC